MQWGKKEEISLKQLEQRERLGVNTRIGDAFERIFSATSFLPNAPYIEDVLLNTDKP